MAADNTNPPSQHLIRGERIVLTGTPESETGASYFGRAMAILITMAVFVPLCLSLTYGEFSAAVRIPLAVVFLVLLWWIGYPPKSDETKSSADVFVVTDMRIYKIRNGVAEDVAPRTDLERMQINGRSAVLKIKGKAPLRIVVGINLMP